MSLLEEQIRRAQNGDQEAKAQLVEENAGLVWSIARRYFGRGMEPDDLFQLGCLGFLKAIEGFDLEFGTQFSTYAVPKITGEIRRFLRDDGSIKVSRSLKERAASIKMARQRLTAQLDREPTLSELAVELELTVEVIAEAETATACTESIHKESGEDGFTLEDVLTEGSMEDTLVERIALKEAIGKLDPRQRRILAMRFYQGKTQMETAAEIGISQAQVSRLEKGAIACIKREL